jgi:hypothetical protein
MSDRVVTDFDGYEWEFEGNIWNLTGQLVWSITFEQNQIWPELDKDDSTISRAVQWDAGGNRVVEDMNGADLDDSFPVKDIIDELAHDLEHQAIYKARERDFIERDYD